MLGYLFFSKGKGNLGTIPVFQILKTGLKQFFVYYSTARYVEREITRSCFSFVMAAIKAVIPTATDPRSLPYQMVTGFVLPA